MDNLEIKVTIGDVKVEVSVPCHDAEQEEVIAVIKSTVEKAIYAWGVGNEVVVYNTLNNSVAELD